MAPRGFEEAGHGSQVGTERAEFPPGVVVIAVKDAADVNTVTRLLLQSRLAAVGHGLVKRLEVFERWLIAFVCGRAEVFVKPPVRCAPSLGLLLAHAPAEVFPQQRMSVEGDEFARTFCPVH